GEGERGRGRGVGDPAPRDADTDGGDGLGALAGGDAGAVALIAALAPTGLGGIERRARGGAPELIGEGGVAVGDGLDDRTGVAELRLGAVAALERGAPRRLCLPPPRGPGRTPGGGDRTAPACPLPPPGGGARQAAQASHNRGAPILAATPAAAPSSRRRREA